MAYQKFWNSDTISHTLNVPSSGDLWIDTSKKEHNLSSGHISELMSGKRNSVKGWTRG